MKLTHCLLLPLPSDIFPGAPTSAFIRIDLAPYQLRYVFEQFEFVAHAEVDDVVTLTAGYLESYFVPRFPEMTTLETTLMGKQNPLLLPFEMNLTSTAVFPRDATTLPAVAELDLVLMSAFSGTNLDVYVDILTRLPPGNVFSTTTEVMFDLLAEVQERSGGTAKGATSGSSDSGGSSGPNKLAIGVSAGAGAFLALLIAAVHVRYRGSGAAASGDGLEKNHLLDEAGHLTVADETYRADSTILGDDSTVTRLRHTRFAESTRFAEFTEGDQSLASRSEWALSTRAISEEGSLVESSSDDEVDDEEKNSRYDSGMSRRRLFDEEEPLRSNDPLAPLRPSEEAVVPPDDLSVDSYVPIRVVDLIKRFSPKDEPTRTRRHATDP